MSELVSLLNYFQIIIESFSKYINRQKILKIAQYNKKIQKIFNLNINDYKKYSKIFTKIDIELIPKKNEYGYFINLSTLKENYKEKNIDQYFHIFFNGDKKETKNKNEIIKGDDIEEIKIIIDC